MTDFYEAVRQNTIWPKLLDVCRCQRSRKTIHEYWQEAFRPLILHPADEIGKQAPLRQVDPASRQATAGITTGSKNFVEIMKLADRNPFVSG